MKISEVTIDNRHGIGSTPYNQEVDYRGLRVLMKPSVFLDLAAFLHVDDRNEYVEKAIADGVAIGAPFLIIKIPVAWFDSGDYSEPAQVVSHEGRNRMQAVWDVEGNKPIETHLFFRDDIRNRDLTPEIIEALNQGMYLERTRALKRGPLFSRMVNETLKRVKGKWALVSKSNPKKVLQYYHGSGHPSKEWVSKVERRVHSFSEGVGRITPQNVTQDVGMDQVSKEAAKFGNKVDRDGYPAQLMRKKSVKENKEPAGDCFKAAGKNILHGEIPGLVLVHAMVTGQGPIEGKRHAHAWNEVGDVVLDNSNGRNIVMRKEQYYEIGKVNADDPKQYRKYDRTAALKWMVKTKNYGPWELDES